MQNSPNITLQFNNFYSVIIIVFNKTNSLSLFSIFIKCIFNLRNGTQKIGYFFLTKC